MLANVKVYIFDRNDRLQVVENFECEENVIVILTLTNESDRFNR